MCSFFFLFHLFVGNIKETELYKLLERKFKIVDFETKNTSKTPVLICYNIPKDYSDVNKVSSFLYRRICYYYCSYKFNIMIIP